MGREGAAPWQTFTPDVETETDNDVPPPETEMPPLPLPGSETLLGRPGVEVQVSEAFLVVLDFGTDVEPDDTCDTLGTDGVGSDVGAPGALAQTFRPLVELADTESEPPPPATLKPPLPDPGREAGDAGGAKLLQVAPVPPPPEGSEGAVSHTVKPLVELADTDSEPPPPETLNPPLPEPGRATGEDGGANVWQLAPDPEDEGIAGGVAQTVRPLAEPAATEAEPPAPDTLRFPLPEPGSAAGMAGAAKCWHPALRPEAASEGAGAPAPKALPTWLAGNTIAPANAPTVAAPTAMAAMPRPRPLRDLVAAPCGGPCSCWCSS